VNTEQWEELYMLAAKEVDGEKVPERVAAVREAIRGRLQDLEGDSDHHEERVYLKSTLGKLDVLEAEAQTW
jgi:hypothetical protein